MSNNFWDFTGLRFPAGFQGNGFGGSPSDDDGDGGHDGDGTGSGRGRKRIGDGDAASRGGTARRVSGVIVAVILAVALLFVLLSRFVTEVMWYSQVGYASVIWTQLGIKVGLWVAYAVLAFGITYFAAWRAIGVRPDGPDGVHYRTGDDGVLEMRAGVTTKTARRTALVVALVIAVFVGSRFFVDWSQIVLLFHAQSFGAADPQFGIDNGFYVFVLPGLRLIVQALVALVFLGLVVSIGMHVVVGGIRFTMPTRGRGIFDVTRRASRQIGVWVILGGVMLAVSRTLDAFSHLHDAGSRFDGASYTTVHATIPMDFAMAGVMLVGGIIIGVWVMTSDAFRSDAVHTSAREALRAWRTPVIVIAASLVIALIGSGIYPAVLSRFRVSPNAQELEAEYIQRNIDATRSAFGIDTVTLSDYDASTQGAAGALSADAETTAQIRLLDPQIVSPTFKQLQQSKQYYSFADTLAVDKYSIDGHSQDTVIAARELNLAGNDNRNWVNDHTVYTHGYGIVAAYGNKITADGQPRFFEQNIPTTGELTDTQAYEPRIYFSPNAPDYSIVGSDTSASWEFDYPSGSSGVTTTFQGDGGPKVSNPLTKLLYSIRFGTDQIFFSDRVNSASQILYYRNPSERVKKVAPYLTLDGRVYPAVVDGRVKWIVDAYTTSSDYPYSQSVDLASVTTDSVTTESSSVTSLQSETVNYMRNSVKAVVDAYDGSVDLYAWNPDDPVLKAWEGVFPNQYKPIRAISGDLMSHLRYPEGLFKVQRSLLATYHVTNASEFFSGEDFWQTPTDPTESDAEKQQGVLQPPYYLTLQTAGMDQPTFSLTSTYIPAGTSTREILTGFLSVDSDAGSETGVVGPNYGTIRLLELPKNSNVPGPGQAQNNFNADADVSKELNLLQQGDTSIDRGNLLTLPIGGGLVYVQPVYVKSNGTTSYPLLKKVLVAFGDQVGFADTLDEALDQVFGGDSGASAGDADQADGVDSTGSSGSSGSSGGDTGSTGQTGQSGASDTPQSSGASGASSDSGTLRKALDDANQAMQDSEQAMKNGDWAAYGEAQQRLKDALATATEQGNALEGSSSDAASSGAASSPSSSSSAS
ncbi:hypothetical protein PSRA_1319 [Pseudoscardovia radai]|uniref:UPF0182 protein PSRA_1319 n=1 Tax=Pseudoscardovia radai TaxID=987066 RepID=A0A261EW10_9BIFI|nr:UPF0182 family protein [Pseudoscardovia radai]OZG51025.1 hypothetical protein PSRA_1319 [Pseudoscardovia radai]